jgi:hypothetical protein
MAMVRSVLGGLVAGLLMFVIGFVFWGTPLSGLAFQKANDAQSAAVQLALAQNLTPGGTGTYLVPTPDTPQGTVAYGQGPIATIHFNARGFAANDLSMVPTGLAFALVAGVLMALGLGAVGAAGFAARARLVILFSLGITTWTLLAQPVFNNYGWAYWVYWFVTQTIAVAAAGLVIARWFLPAPRAETTPPTAEAAEPTED